MVPALFKKNRGIGSLPKGSDLFKNLVVDPARLKDVLLSDVEDPSWKVAILLHRNEEGVINEGSYALGIRGTTAVKLAPHLFPIPDDKKDRVQIILTINFDSLEFPSRGLASNLSSWVDGKRSSLHTHDISPSYIAGLPNTKVLLDDQEVPFTEVSGMERGFSFRLGISPVSESQATLSLFAFPRGKVWMESMKLCTEAGTHMENVPATRFTWKTTEAGNVCSWIPRDESLGLGFLPFLASSNPEPPAPTLEDLAGGQAAVLKMAREPPSMAWAQLVKWSGAAEVEGQVQPAKLNWNGMEAVRPAVQWTDYSREHLPQATTSLSAIRNSLQVASSQQPRSPPALDPSFKIEKKGIVSSSAWSQAGSSITMEDLDQLDQYPEAVQIQSMKRKLYEISREKDADMEPPASASKVAGTFTLDDDGYTKLDGFTLRMRLRPPNCASSSWWQDERLGVSTRYTRPVRGSSLYMGDVCGSKTLNPRTIKALHDR